MKDEKWYREEVAKLQAIVRQNKKEEYFVSRDYIIEKLDRILSEIGIGIHPCLEKLFKKGGDYHAKLVRE